MAENRSELEKRLDGLERDVKTLKAQRADEIKRREESEMITRQLILAVAVVILTTFVQWVLRGGLMNAGV